jgi:ribosomal protein S18 acetylase RimI-like enzyme
VSRELTRIPIKNRSIAEKFFVRNYRPSDFSQIEQIWRKTGMAAAERGDTRPVVERTLRQGGRMLVVAERETGRIVGASWLTQDGRRLTLHHFGILPSFQRRGLAKLLLAETFKVVQKIGLQVKLEVHRKNVKAIRLYRRAGFKKLGDYDVYIIRDVTRLV